MKKIFFLLLLILSIVSVFAQEQDKGSSLYFIPKKKIDLTGLPTLSFDQSKGIGVGGIGMAFFKLNNHPDTKPSSVNVFGKYSTKGNWNVGAISQLYFGGDKFRLALGGGYMNSDFQVYFQEVSGEIEVPYNNHGGFFFVTPSYKVWDNLFIGIGAQIFKSHLDINRSSIDPNLPDSVSTNWMNSFAISGMYDTRDNTYNATKGMMGSFRLNVFPVWLKNESTFYKINFQYNYYHRLDKNKVLAARAVGNINFGKVPFVAQSYVGGRDIRGYTKGEYRGNQTYAAQAELRWNFWHRWGCVGFFGLAMAVDPIKDPNNPDALDPGKTSPLLPGLGAGLRYLVLPKYGINLGMDAAVGKNDWGLYFRITEAF